MRHRGALDGGVDSADLPAHSAKYFMKFSLFSRAVVVGRPRFSLAPIAAFTSMNASSADSLACFSASSSQL